MNVFRLLRAGRESSADRVALVEGTGTGRRELRYGELEGSVDRVILALQARGLGAGDRVLLAVPQSIDTCLCMLALFKAGMVVMLVDPAHSPTTIARILRMWPPAAVIGTRALLRIASILREVRSIPVRLTPQDCAGAPGAVVGTLDAVARQGADSALLTFTSGSTGDPKPVIRTHGFLRRQLEMLAPVADTGVGDVDFVAMPMFVLFNLGRGICSVLPACDMKRPAEADPAAIYRQLVREQATRMVASPALLARLARYCNRRRLRLPSMRRFSTGGGPVDPGLARRLQRVAPGAAVRMVYGSTEAEPIAFIDAEGIAPDDARDMRSGGGLLAGEPVPGCLVRILRTAPGCAMPAMSGARFSALRCRDGDIGEIVVSGPHVLSAYADPSRNALTKIDVDGTIWHRTGDAGRFDDRGRLWLAGRLGAAIRDAHGTVYPFQVEYALSTIRGIRRAALILRNGRRLLVLESRGRQFSPDCASAAACIARHHVDGVMTLRSIPVDRRHGAKVDYPALQRRVDGRRSRLLYSALAALARFVSGLRRLARTAREMVSGNLRPGRSCRTQG